MGVGVYVEEEFSSSPLQRIQAREGVWMRSGSVYVKTELSSSHQTLGFFRIVASPELCNKSNNVGLR